METWTECSAKILQLIGPPIPLARHDSSETKEFEANIFQACSPLITKKKFHYSVLIEPELKFTRGKARSIKPQISLCAAQLAVRNEQVIYR